MLFGSATSITNSGSILSAGAGATVSSATNYWNDITNSGTIANRGTGSAIAGTYGAVTNSAGGLITAAAGNTITRTSSLSLDNAGTISNTGTGAAVVGSGGITNRAGGTISASGTAILSTAGLSLRNDGSIIGNVVAGSAQGTSYSSVDSTAGTITGNVTFGGGNDVLVATYSDAGGLNTGITGRIDGGGGTDTVRARFSADATLSRAIVLPTNFEAFALVADSGVTVTLQDGFAAPGTLSFSGDTLVNETRLSGRGAVLNVGSATRFRNEGDIAGEAAANQYTLVVSGGQFTNNGTISSQGDAVNSLVYAFSNTGTITAAGTAVNAFNMGAFENSGTIRSTAGTGLILWGSSTNLNYAATNSGTIEGAQVGVNLSDMLANTGTITSDRTGVMLGAYGTLYNKAGGTISGGTAAIASPTGLGSRLFGARVINEGTINGDVSIVSNSPYPDSYNTNIFYALSGGVLNGNLTLGMGDTLVADITNTGTSQFAGINGTVTASGSNVRYMVSQDASATVDGLVGFSGLGYDLYDGATLTLGGSTVQTAPIVFAGYGKAVLDVDFNVVGQPAIMRGSLLNPFPVSQELDGVSITNRGAITVNRLAPFTYYGAAVLLGYHDSFTNEGTITVIDTSGQAGAPLSAISGGEVVNSGTITVRKGNGINGATSLTNSGTITASDVAALDIQETVTNSGSLVSTGGVAIATSSYSPALLVDNKAGGTIAGNGTAIRLSGGAVINAGAIEGTVDLGYTPYFGRSYASGLYVAAGGTLTGDLLFGSGNDVIVETGSGLGVSGRIVAGSGSLYLGHERSHTASITLQAAPPAGFQREFVSARGQDTVLTITAASTVSGDIMLAGDGQIVNEASTHGSIIGPDSALLSFSYFSGYLASFTNKAQVDGQIRLGVSSLHNSGTVGSAAWIDNAVYQGASGALSFDNAGSVTSAGGRNAAPTVRLDGSGLASATIANSGTITGGGLLATLSFDGAAGIGAAPTGSFVNSGTISGAYGVTLASSVTNNTVTNNTGVNSSETGPADTMPLSLSVTNSGTIEATAFAGSALVSQISGPAALTITNSGTIRASGAGFVSYELLDWYTCFYTPGPCQYVASAEPALAIGSFSDSLTPGNAVTTSITNTASGVIEATGSVSTAIRSDNPLTLVNSGTITGTDFTVEPFYGDAGPEGTIRFAGAIQTFGTGNDSITNSGTINGSIDLAGGNDIVVNTGTINGNVMLGDGDDRFVERLSAVVTGTVDGGAGANTLTIDLTGGGTLNASYFDRFTHFGTVALTGSGSIAASGVLPVQTLFLDAGSTFELQAGSTLQTLGATALTGTDGADHVINRGTIVGDVALGGGDDLFEVYGAASVRGHVDGGAGSDRLVFHLDDAAGRTAMDVRPYTGFEQLALESGTGTLSGDVGFDTISINGGRLIGLAGSTISAPGGITVARGATFGSAGTVNGAILVNGTLSPGASPGTMRVNGNVTLASGSTTYFEMTPTVSDALVITGNLAIASGTTLQIVGERPLTPGIRYHLITATDGITGSFATIDKIATVQGFIMQTADSIDLLGTLQLHAGASRAVTATTTYLNDLLITGAASDQLMAAMPQLTSADGYVNAAAVATLHPEAYAAASQIGMDNGLAISSALRSTQRAGEGAHRGLFTLGQGLGGWQTMRGNAAAGTANARDNTGGFLGGIGYQAGKVAFAAFAGRIYANQTLPARAASTRANGTFVGGMVSFANRGLDLGGSVTWDDSAATTRRTLFDASTATGDYALHTLTFDAHGGYGFALGRGGWRIGPELGVTHIRVKRGEARETGGSLFALDVAGRRQQATFLSADVRLDMAASARLRPWLTAGWRRRLGGNAMLATASLSGVAAQFTVEGARRDRDYAQIGGGFDWTATPGVILFARGSSAVTNAYGTTNVTGGIRLGF